MAGHSKWANIKHKKGAADARRAKVFTKLNKEIMVAARLGGGDPSANPRLRIAVEKARSNSIPKDNIERAIKKGTGELGADNIEEVTYEGYASGGVAVIVDCTTDNKTRTVAEVRTIFSKKGGNLGESGSVAWMFDKKGIIRIDVNIMSEEILFEKSIEAGAEDLKREDEYFVVTTAFEDYISVLDALTGQGVVIKESSVEMVPKNIIEVQDEDSAQKILILIEALEDNDDVQNVWANFDISDALMEKIAS